MSLPMLFYSTKPACCSAAIIAAPVSLIIAGGTKRSTGCSIFASKVAIGVKRCICVAPRKAYMARKSRFVARLFLLG